MTRSTSHLALTALLCVAGCSRAATSDPPAGGRSSFVPAKPTPVSPAVDSPAPAPRPASARPRGPYVPTPIPTDAEYAAVREVTVRHSSSLGCETKMVREWLRVACASRTPKETASFGGLSAQIAPGSRPQGGRAFSFANPFGVWLPVVPGASHRVSFDGDWGARYLTVTWPEAADAPTMAFDQPASPPTCRGPADCPGQACCSTGRATFCSAACDPGLQAQVCAKDGDCPVLFGRATLCAPPDAAGLRTCR